MDKRAFLSHVEYAYDTMAMKPESIFLFKLFQFDFSYDDENGTCTITCPITEFMLNPNGIVHGGVLTFLADTAMGHLNLRTKDAPYVTLELKNSFLNAATTGQLIATSRYVKEGFRICYLECEITNDHGKPLCVTSGTFYRFDKRT